ncbi:MAG: hypothetical protein ABSG84_18695 [Acidobacteriaceae bacterium]|jgi:hypothetical protein
MNHNPSVWDRIAIYSAAVGAVGTLIAVVVSIWLASGQLREMRDEVKIQHLIEESNKFDQEPLLTSRKNLAKKRIDQRKEVLLPLDPDDAPTEMWDILNECDEVGLLSKRGYLDVADVWSQMGYWLFDVYADAEPVVESDRKGSPTSRPNPASMENCSWLIEQMRPIEAARNRGSDLNPSKVDLYKFYVSEMDTESVEPPSHSTQR